MVPFNLNHIIICSFILAGQNQVLPPSVGDFCIIQSISFMNMTLNIIYIFIGLHNIFPIKPCFSFLVYRVISNLENTL